jgi:hypothetical protein
MRAPEESEAGGLRRGRHIMSAIGSDDKTPSSEDGSPVWCKCERHGRTPAAHVSVGLSSVASVMKSYGSIKQTTGIRTFLGSPDALFRNNCTHTVLTAPESPRDQFQ